VGLVEPVPLRSAALLSGVPLDGSVRSLVSFGPIGIGGLSAKNWGGYCTDLTNRRSPYANSIAGRVGVAMRQRGGSRARLSRVRGKVVEKRGNRRSGLRGSRPGIHGTLSVQVRYYSGAQKQAAVPVSDTREKAYSFCSFGS
jgi:hypothetical protein